MSSSVDALRVSFETYSKIGGSLTGMTVSYTGGREGGREGGKKGGREGEREGGWEGGREGGWEGGRKERKINPFQLWLVIFITSLNSL